MELYRRDIKGDIWSVHQIEDTSLQYAGCYFVYFQAKGEEIASWHSDPFRSLESLFRVYPQVRYVERISNLCQQ